MFPSLKGMKANVSEAEHPLLCESTRKQRGELTMAMLLHYKDDIVKLSKVIHLKHTHIQQMCSKKL